MEALAALDRSILFALNGEHGSHWDAAWTWLTWRWTWLPLYLGLAWVLWRQYKAQVWRPLVVVLLVVAMGDVISTHVLKPGVGRLRPCRDAAVAPSLHIAPGTCNSPYGFPSNHATNTAAAGLFLGLVLSAQRRWLWPTLGAWVLINGASRVVLGVHYPTDVLGGWVLGGGLGALGINALRWILPKND